MPKVETQSKAILNGLATWGWIVGGGKKHTKLFNPAKPGIKIMVPRLSAAECVSRVGGRAAEPAGSHMVRHVVGQYGARRTRRLETGELRLL